MQPHEQVRLSKAVAHALRHAPWIYELEPDDEGWVLVDDLLIALRQRRGMWHKLTGDDLASVIAASDKRRYEIQHGRIRALYGHSLPGKLAKIPAAPPDILFHGTSERVLAAILEEGLKPMGRQYVHLSVDEATARQVGKRKQGQVVILGIRAATAHRKGVVFYEGNEMVWLADFVPPEFIVCEAP